MLLDQFFPGLMGILLSFQWTGGDGGYHDLGRGADAIGGHD